MKSILFVIILKNLTNEIFVEFKKFRKDKQKKNELILSLFN
jgi:hypothetical protein